MLLLVISTLYAIASGGEMGKNRQQPLALPGSEVMPGSSIVKLCPESHNTDVLNIERIVNEPPVPYLYVTTSACQYA